MATDHLRRAGSLPVLSDFNRTYKVRHDGDPKRHPSRALEHRTGDRRRSDYEAPRSKASSGNRCVVRTHTRSLARILRIDFLTRALSLLV